MHKRKTTPQSQTILELSPKFPYINNSQDLLSLAFYLIYKIIIVIQLPKIYLFDNIICVYTNKNITFRRHGEKQTRMSHGEEALPNNII
jgi:hypothetical protein